MMNRMDCYYRIGKLSAARDAISATIKLPSELVENEKLFAAYATLDDAFKAVMHAEAEHSITLKGDDKNVHQQRY